MNNNLDNYFEELKIKTNEIYTISNNVRKLGFDLKPYVEIPLASDIGSRVEGLISTIYPNILNSGIRERILELENIYPKLDLRIALIIAKEVSEQKFCKFKNIIEAAEIGVRIGFSYLTLGVISAPIEGFINFEIKQTTQNKNYLEMNFAGPIRAAGGTAGAFSVLIADYVRKNLKFENFDITEEEQNRFITEVLDYDKFATKLQYLPSEEEIKILVQNLGIEISGNETEDREVSNFKDLKRIKQNKIRGGMCLIIAECLIQKAPKILKRIQKWGNEFNLQNWLFLEDLVSLQKKQKQTKNNSNNNDFTSTKYLDDIVAGRPIFTFPNTKGGFRLRYGRSRNTGFASTGISSETFEILEDFLGYGTQLRIEKPGKSTIVMPVDNLESPIVKLKSGEIIKLDSIKKAKKYSDKIEEIIHLGDILISYGEFSENNHNLLPVGYTPEEWELELEEKIN